MTAMQEGPFWLPLGRDHPMARKLAWARELHRAHGEALLADAGIRGLLERYCRAVAATAGQMQASGVLAECADCAVNDGGSCCGRGIEDRFDVVLLLVNLLAGCDLPVTRFDSEGCFFLGEKGCRIVARHVLCVNYVCRRLEKRLTAAELRALQEKIGAEADAAFALEEEIKRWFRQKASSMTNTG